ncbi:hypothetical protein [Frigoriflavimonas asaccharolytica]|uniref:Uncharacterized protein YjbJ (UPF0337 family) n=1 Tax=Frigoriflavimonas asaccharolytica TaxID=2735899 RepID=A0A8J8GC62_9FLAO|nr:hypothetical protein [Frigoriflavimonas asaccharolytica]NRS93022.1 uncharacterized protein YjbJ (UPF0337 family) [Frigoriflavimonas asaccharolytica]
MDNQDYNKAENAVDKVKWKAEDLADRAKAYINEKRDNDEEATHEGWLERAKDNVADAWEDTKDAVSNAWEGTKDAAVDAEAEVKKATN